jgi:hypothetical protein
MIIEEKIIINVTHKNKNHFVNKGYIIPINNRLKISSLDLLQTSHEKVKCKCDICNLESYIKCYNYWNNYNNYNIYTCNKCCVFKKKLTTLENFGVENPSTSKEIKEKKKKTTLENFGVEHPLQNEELLSKMKNTFKKSINDRNLTFYDKILNFEIYTKKVRKLTNKVRKDLFNDWCGYDYYDGEFIEENLKLNKNDGLYPTIDHKISIYYGFNNGLNIEEISSIDNLCITKRIINSSKNKKCHHEN